MIPGYNHNVQYKGEVYHVQTEDSGRDKGHVITHLFVGGNIVESRKSVYGHLVSAPDCDVQVANLMQRQHKEMLRGLIKGSFDARIKERSPGASFLHGPAPLNVAGGLQHRASFGASPGAPPPAAKPAAGPTRPSPAGDGTFSVGDAAFLDELRAAAPVILAEDLQKALDSDDDEFVFGKEVGGRLDDLMLGFMKNL